MTNYYLRSLLPDGTGEVVQPTEREPANEQSKAFSRWFLENKRLPVIATATKELVAANGLGWVKECKVRYQFLLKSDTWEDTKLKYYNYYGQPFRRILLDVLAEERGSMITGEETVALTRKQVEDVWDNGYILAKAIFGRYALPEKLPHKEAYIDSLFKHQHP